MARPSHVEGQPVQTKTVLGYSETSFGNIEDPGSYVVHQTGSLMRIPEDALSAGRSPKMEIVGNDPLTVTKISDNPYLPLGKARLVAADLDLQVNF